MWGWKKLVYIDLFFFNVMPHKGQHLLKLFLFSFSPVFMWFLFFVYIIVKSIFFNHFSKMSVESFGFREVWEPAVPDQEKLSSRSQMPVQIGSWSVRNAHWAAHGRESTIPATGVLGSRVKEESLPSRTLLLILLSHLVSGIPFISLRRDEGIIPVFTGGTGVGWWWASVSDISIYFGR